MKEEAKQVRILFQTLVSAPLKSLILLLLQVVKDNAVPMGQTSTGELAYWRRKEDKPKPPFKREDKKKIDSRSRNNLDFDRWMAKKKGEAVHISKSISLILM